MLLTAILTLTVAAPALPQDRVYLASGTTQSGKIESATFEKVTLSADGGSQEIDARTVLRLGYGNAPEPYTRAQSFLQQLDYQNAVASYESAAETENPSWVPEYSKLGRAEALLAWARIDSGRASEAATAYRDWTAAYPDSFELVRGKIGLARATALAGQVDEAAQQLEALASLAFEKDLGRHVELRARLERCEVYLSGGQAQVAKTRLDDLVPNIQRELSDSQTEAGLRPRLRVLLSRAQIALGDSIEAKDGSQAAKAYWDRLLQDASVSVDVRAAGLVGQATDALEQGRNREAQLLLARVVATLPAGPEVMSRAVFRLGEVTKALGGTPVSSKLYFEQVVRDYPNTSWAAKAKEALR